MVAHREFSAWINCDGFVLDEYEVRVDSNGPRATCWIPSVAGKVRVLIVIIHAFFADSAICHSTLVYIGKTTAPPSLRLAIL